MNQIALDFIKARESCRLTGYRDSGGVWTVGWGATGPGVAEGIVWTQAQADQELARRVAAIETSVSMETQPPGLTLRQAAALISFAYNVGVNAFATSHVRAFVLAGNWIAAVKALLTWDHVDGIESRGLLKRRLEEAALFLEGSG